ncbi:hypothetical protein FOZ63_004507 [Perkinsus olseni]|uniref:Uncharacterized protein n=1 Tax=Perkinsus olseni TaxID=32597 RepID=A0A7J6SGP9_PEROL|nr:hypothetical protein FOZ63_004507 [Perkinsus olseni]KAF4734184.1 hypothetical protein FOZ62_002895 [Perkinsus olseni]
MSIDDSPTCHIRYDWPDKIFSIFAMNATDDPSEEGDFTLLAETTSSPGIHIDYRTYRDGTKYFRFKTDDREDGAYWYERGSEKDASAKDEMYRTVVWMNRRWERGCYIGYKPPGVPFKVYVKKRFPPPSEGRSYLALAVKVTDSSQPMAVYISYVDGTWEFKFREGEERFWYDEGEEQSVHASMGKMNPFYHVLSNIKTKFDMGENSLPCRKIADYIEQNAVPGRFQNIVISSKEVQEERACAEMRSFYHDLIRRHQRPVQKGVVAFGAHQPNARRRVFELLSNFQALEMLVEAEEADGATGGLYPSQGKAVHVTMAMEGVGGCLAHE